MVEAEYQLTRCENAYSMSVPLWSVLPLTRERTFLYGIVPECDVVGRVEGQGGRKNHTVSFDPEKQAWVMWHMGHSLPILVNGTPTMKGHNLRTGDVIGPGPGIEFTFSLTAETYRVLAIIEAEGPAVLERNEPLIDRTIELIGCDAFHAQRIITAVVARRRGLPPLAR